MKQFTWTPEIKVWALAQLETRTQPDVARELGTTQHAIESMVRRHRRQGPTGNPAVTTPANVHEGLSLHGQSTLTGVDGNVKARWDLARKPADDPAPLPPGFLAQSVSRGVGGDGGVFAEWTRYTPERVAQWEAARAAVQEHVSEYVRAATPVDAPAATDADLLAVYPLGDPHIGMLAWAAEVGESFDLRIAERELCECFRQLVARAPAARRAIVTNLGDFWHATDNAQRTAKSGHKLDVDGRAGKVGKVGLRIMHTLVDAALEKHEHVTVKCIPGNHDDATAFWLPAVMTATYRNEPRVTVEDAFNPYQFTPFGSVLIGWAHGDGAKIEALGEIMARDVEPALWAGARFRVWHTGHVHHMTTKELRTCVVHTHRTMAGRDAWHHHAGYRSGQGLEVFAYHRDWGYDGRQYVGVERVRRALDVGDLQ
jgi:hypothetical protein